MSEIDAAISPTATTPAIANHTLRDGPRRGGGAWCSVAVERVGPLATGCSCSVGAAEMCDADSGGRTTEAVGSPASGLADDGPPIVVPHTGHDVIDGTTIVLHVSHRIAMMALSPALGLRDRHVVSA